MSQKRNVSWAMDGLPHLKSTPQQGIQVAQRGRVTDKQRVLKKRTFQMFIIDHAPPLRSKAPLTIQRNGWAVMDIHGRWICSSSVGKDATKPRDSALNWRPRGTGKIQTATWYQPLCEFERERVTIQEVNFILFLCIFRFPLHSGKGSHTKLGISGQQSNALQMHLRPPSRLP